MHLDPAHLLSSLFHPLPLQPPPPKIKQNLRGRKEKGKISSWKPQCDTVSHAENPLSIHVYMQALIAKNHWSGLSLGLPGHSVNAVCHGHGDPATLGPQYSPTPLPMLQQIRDGVDFGVSQHITMVLDLGSCSVGQPGSWKWLRGYGKDANCTS